MKTLDRRVSEDRFGSFLVFAMQTHPVLLSDQKADIRRKSIVRLLLANLGSSKGPRLMSDMRGHSGHS